MPRARRRRSSSVRFGRRWSVLQSSSTRPKPPRPLGHLKTLAPSCERSLFTLVRSPSISAIIVTTVVTPMTMPSSVSSERSGLRQERAEGQPQVVQEGDELAHRLIRSGALPRGPGSRRAPPARCRTAGPPAAAKPTPPTTVSGCTAAASAWSPATTTFAAPSPTAVPRWPRPPRTRCDASMRNWNTMVRLRAPSARRTPISRVRSRTRHQHDVHDADAAHQQRDEAHAHGHAVERAGELLVGRRRAARAG